MGRLAARIDEEIHRRGPIPFSRFMELALYDPSAGFFTRGGRPGRAGADFITSPEVGPLFGRLVARELDRRWAALDRPDPFLVVDAGAGSGRLAREVLRAEPACTRALRLVLVERSAAARAAQREQLHLEPAEDALGPFARPPGVDELEPVEQAGPIVTALDDLPQVHARGVVLANELLDDLPFDLVQRDRAGWLEVRVARATDGTLTEVVVPAADDLAEWVDDLPGASDLAPGTRLPAARAIDDWLVRAARVLRRGAVIVVDYAAPLAELAPRGQAGWLRTYAQHERGSDPLTDPGHCDITADLVLEAVRRGVRRAGLRLTRETRQAEWLHDLGIEELVDEGRAAWRAGAARADLAALAGRSRATEAAALTDASGLGAHAVVVGETT